MSMKLSTQLKKLGLPYSAAALLMFLPFPSGRTFSSTGQVFARPGDNIQSLINANPPGTSFVITPGIYRLQSVQPKNGDVFTGEQGAVLNGAQILNSFKPEGQNWVTEVTVTTEKSYRGQCDKEHAACMYPEDLFFDSKPLTRVASLSQVGPGAWYLDY
ncbi:MAG: hypothetical protein EPN47_01855, partial [Acidobacteria bacterium]